MDARSLGIRCAAVAVCVVMSACSGGSRVTELPSVVPTAIPRAAGRVSATLKIVVPAKAGTPASVKRAPAYVSPATQSIAIAFTPSAGGTTQTYNENLTPATNPNCVASLISPEVCTVTLTLAPGTYTATFATYDGLLDGNGNPQGSVLSQNQNIPVTIVAGQSNAINVTLQGVPTSVALIPGAASTMTGSQSAGFGLSKCFTSETVSVVGVDADGNYIVGPGAPAPSLTSSETAKLAVTGPATGSPNTFTLTPPAIPNADATIMLLATVTPGSGGGPAVSANISLTFDATICGTFTEYVIPTLNSAPEGITSGPDGALWFTETNSNKIGRLSVSGTFTEYGIPTLSEFPQGITVGPDGALWFVEFPNAIERISTGGAFTEYVIPTSTAAPQQIISGPDGALWFTEAGADKIGSITTSGTFTEYVVPTLGSPIGIASGSDGGLWFSQPDGGARIGRVSTSGSFTEYTVPTSTSGPYGIALGPDGALWFTENGASKIGRVSTGGIFAEFVIPTAFSQPIGITPGQDGALWFTEGATNKIGRISTSGAFTEYLVPSSTSAPHGITSGPDGAIWFVETNTNKIGRLQ